MPTLRPRRLRVNSAIRDWVSQTRLCARDMILPYFVLPGRDGRTPIKSLPGICRLSSDNLLRDLSETQAIKSVLLFGIAPTKDKAGTAAYQNDGVVQTAIRAIKKRRKDLIVITDVCLCGYTTHGHCGLIRRNKKGGIRNTEYAIDNDATLKVLAKIALSHAACGADFVAPSAMMDGQVGAIRAALDAHGFQHVGILAYSAKYASNFYGPFREALDSAPQFGDRKTYQMDYRNSLEALKEVQQDIDQGADIVMVKPALAYLDVLRRLKEKFDIPVAAYNVSGEYNMIKRSVDGNQCAERELALEVLTAIKRAGADWIITYWAKEAARWLDS